MAGGRPSSFKPEYIGQAKKLVALGATDMTLADFFGVAVSSISKWKNDYPEFSDALKESKADLDSKVERSLYERAVGYKYPAIKIMQYQGVPIEVPYTEHIAPDTTAQIFWLKNRQPARWRDKQDHEHTGKDGGAIQIVVGNQADKDILEKL